MTSKSKDVLWS